MLTLFATGKPFRGHSGVIQRNALKSWTLLHPDVEVILFGNDEGAAEVARDLGIWHEPHAERHESGMKYLNYMFSRAQQIARHEYLCYLNCDIILLSDFRRAFARVRSWRDRFLMVGRRWDVDIKDPLDFASPAWEQGLLQRALAEGLQRPSDTLDYFVFRRGLYDQIPPLVVGRIWWDHWLVWKALERGVPVVDVSAALVAVHQNHDYAYHPQGTEGVYRGQESQENFRLAGNGRHLRTMEDATHRMTVEGTIRRTPLRKPLFLVREFLWKILVQKTFPARRRLGLRREAILRALGKESARAGKATFSQK